MLKGDDWPSSFLIVTEIPGFVLLVFCSSLKNSRFTVYIDGHLGTISSGSSLLEVKGMLMFQLLVTTCLISGCLWTPVYDRPVSLGTSHIDDRPSVPMPTQPSLGYDSVGVLSIPLRSHDPHSTLFPAFRNYCQILLAHFFTTGCTCTLPGTDVMVLQETPASGT